MAAVDKADAAQFSEDEILEPEGWIFLSFCGPAHAAAAREQIVRCATVHGDLVVLDLRDEEVIHPTSRFTVYALFPGCSVSMHGLWGLKQQNTVFAVGKSIVDRTGPVDVGTLMLGYGGGGHAAAGTCQIDNERAAAVQAELIGRLNTR